MKATHTPGDWWAGSDGDSNIVYANHGDAIDFVAETTRDDGDSETESANARLIASAPDLLAACESFVRWAVRANVINEPEDEKILAGANAAIAKARGE